MSCWLFHDWSKWDKVNQENYHLDGSVGECTVQIRRCNRCGKWQKEYL